jgi:hypothetical protein
MMWCHSISFVDQAHAEPSISGNDLCAQVHGQASCKPEYRRR